MWTGRKRMTTKTTFPPKRRSYERGDVVRFRGMFFGVVLSRHESTLQVRTIGEKWNGDAFLPAAACSRVSQFVYRYAEGVDRE